MKKAITIIIYGLSVLLLLSLGTWQVTRGLHKADVLASAETKDYQQLTEIPTDNIALDYQSAELQGKWIDGKEFLLDNRAYQSQQGYEVLSLFQLDSGQYVLINRGWIDKKKIAETSLATKNTQPRGKLYEPKKGYTIGEAITDTSENWPKISLYMDVESFAKKLALPVSPLILVLDAENANSFQRVWTPVVVPPERHYAYAMQWYGLSIVLMVFGFIWRKKRLL